MLKKAITKALKHRHFWRDVGFDELSELYVAVMLRGLAISMTGLFVPLYMLLLGYSPLDVCVLVAWFFSYRIILDITAAYVIAAIGPKHTMLIGYVFQILSTISFVLLSYAALPLWLLGLLWGASATFFFVPFHVDFSKVKHSEHGGKELSYVNIMERVGSLLGPVVGGLIASLFGGQYLFLVAGGVLLLGLIPLFQSAEPVRIHQKLSFASLDVSKLKRDFSSHVAFGLENTLSMLLWPLFLAATVLVGTRSYVQFGVILSVSFMISIVSARIVGRKIDRREGQSVLRYNAWLNAILHLIRPFVSNFGGAFAVNMANEAVTPGYRMPYLKGMYDAADDLPGYRIVYLSTMECSASMVKAAVWWGLALVAANLQLGTLFVVGFMLAAVSSVLISTEKFMALNARKS
ncbi:MAG: MFS transporter [Patescibacteria group bacterium]